MIPESGIVSQFLVDAYPSHLVPQTGSVEGALRRARIAFFVDAYFSKFQSHANKILYSKSDADIEASVTAALEGLVKEVEPLLADAKPFFGGSDKLTLAEVITQLDFKFPFFPFQNFPSSPIVWTMLVHRVC